MNDKKLLAAYQKFANQMDDYFEYRYKKHTQEENRQYVQDCLDKITLTLKEIMLGDKIVG